MTDKRLRYVIIEKETSIPCADGDSILESDDKKEIMAILAAIMVGVKDEYYNHFAVYDTKRKRNLNISINNKTFLKHAFIRNEWIMKLNKHRGMK